MLNVDDEYDVGGGDDDVLEKKGCGAGDCTPGINEPPLLGADFHQVLWSRK